MRHPARESMPWLFLGHDLVQVRLTSSFYVLIYAQPLTWTLGRVYT